MSLPLHFVPPGVTIVLLLKDPTKQPMSSSPSSTSASTAGYLGLICMSPRYHCVSEPFHIWQPKAPSMLQALQLKHVGAFGVPARPSGRLKETVIRLKDADGRPVTKWRNLPKGS